LQGGRTRQDWDDERKERREIDKEKRKLTERRKVRQKCEKGKEK
jgi:hypothetical protein